jgi:hypothetical protein
VSSWERALLQKAKVAIKIPTLINFTRPPHLTRVWFLLRRRIVDLSDHNFALSSYDPHFLRTVYASRLEQLPWRDRRIGSDRGGVEELISEKLKINGLEVEPGK